MILKCECVNSTADALHGKGYRPHVRLVKMPGRVQEYLCHYCCYVRTKAQGMASGMKSGNH